MTALTTFIFTSGLNLRSLNCDGEPWFIASDVCHVLEHTNVTVALLGIDTDDRAKDSLGRKGGATNLINEPGLYPSSCAAGGPGPKPSRSGSRGPTCRPSASTGPT